MATWEDFLVDLVADLIGFALVSVAVYLFFQRRERKNQQRLVETVVSRLDRAFNSFIANMIYNLRSDVLEPLEASSFLLNVPPPPLIGNMEKLQIQVEETLRKRDTEAALQARKKQWEIVLSEEFLEWAQQVIGQWNKKQWTKYYLFLETLLKQIRDLMDLYQSRLPSDTVRKLMDFETETETFRFYMDTFPEFFGRVDELEIPLTRNLMASRKTYQIVASESLHSIYTYMTKLQDELKKS